MNIDISDAQLRSLAKLAIAMFVAHRQGVEGLEKLEKEAISGFALHHDLDRDAIQHFYLQAMETLAKAPFVYCAIHSRESFIDAIQQNPKTPDEVLMFVQEGIQGVRSEMNFTDPGEMLPDLIIQ